MVFSEQVFLAFPLNAYDNREDISQAILGLNYLGQTTNTPEALVVTRTECFNPSNGDRPDVDNLAVIITDGVPFPDERREPAIQEGRALRDSDAVMVSIGITDVIDEDFLRELSSPPQVLGTNYFTATDFTALEEIRKRVVEGTCETVQGMSGFLLTTFSQCFSFPIPFSLQVVVVLNRLILPYVSCTEKDSRLPCLSFKMFSVFA